MISTKNKLCMRGMRIEDQAENFYEYVYDLLDAMTKVHDKHLGDEVVILSRKVVYEVEMNLLDLNIYVGCYDRQIRDYLDDNGYVYQNFTS